MSKPNWVWLVFTMPDGREVLQRLDADFPPHIEMWKSDSSQFEWRLETKAEQKARDEGYRAYRARCKAELRAMG